MSGRPSPVVALGDRALLVETADVSTAHSLAGAVQAAGDLSPAPIEEVVVGYSCVLVVLVLDAAGGITDVAEWLAELASSGHAGRPDTPVQPTRHLVPVVFDGADLDEVAALVGTSSRRVVDLLVAASLEVAFVGFAPGFPYLTGLPDELAALPRRATPRTAVPAGSVAVAGGFASIYPRSTPGGWHLVGRTGVALFDPSRPPYSVVAPGDRVRFVESDPTEAPATKAAPRPLLDAGDGPCFEVLDPGLLSLVEDGGRVGVAGLGVPRSGAADPEAWALANLLLGNESTAAAIECTASGPTLRMVGSGHVAVVGAAAGAVDLWVDGHPVPDGTVVPVADGQTVTVGRVRTGLRAYLGVAGGLRTPTVFGSRSSDVLAGLGPGPLGAGDRLARGTPVRPRARLTRSPAAVPGTPARLRVLPGPDGARDGAGLLATVWRVGPDADRVGVRLDPVDRTPLPGAGHRGSVPVVTGAVQLPPDGRPIVLLPDHATVGGYPLVACVVTADLPLLGQLRPGDEVAFVAVTREEAADALGRCPDAMASRVSGWFPTAAAT